MYTYIYICPEHVKECVKETHWFINKADPYSEMIAIAVTVLSMANPLIVQLDLYMDPQIDHLDPYMDQRIAHKTAACPRRKDTRPRERPIREQGQ